jgi:hypothetical protein
MPASHVPWIVPRPDDQVRKDSIGDESLRRPLPHCQQSGPCLLASKGQVCTISAVHRHRMSYEL